MNSKEISKQNRKGSKFQDWMRNRFVVEYEKHIQAMVYVGAAFWVIIVGLRGLGDLSNISFVPDFLLNDQGKIQANIVMLGLLVEFTMLCLLATVSFFAPTEKKEDLQSSIDNLSASVKKLSESTLTDAAKKIMATAEKTSSIAEDLLSHEIQILNDYRNKLDRRLIQVDQQIVQIRENISQGMVESVEKIKYFVENEKNAINKYNELIENLIVEANSALNRITQIVSYETNSLFNTTEKSMNRQKDLLENFYKTNSKLLAETRENYMGFLKNFSELVERENKRMNWVTANQLRPEEFMINMNRTNERLVTHLENIDNSLKIIMNEIGASDKLRSGKISFYKKVKLKWRELLDEFQ